MAVSFLVQAQYLPYRRQCLRCRHNRMTADLPLVDVPVHWMKPLRDRMKMMLAAEGCEWNYSETPVVVYVNR